MSKVTCPFCGDSKAHLRRDQGSTQAGATWYRETLKCKNCRLMIQGVKPGQAEFISKMRDALHWQHMVNSDPHSARRKGYDDVARQKVDEVL